MRPVAAVSASSLWILITHFRIWPELAERMPLFPAFVATVAAGVAIRALADAATRWARVAAPGFRVISRSPLRPST